MPFSRVMGKGGKGKGGRVTKVWTAAKKWEPKGKSKGKADGRGGGQWFWVEEPKVYKTKGKGKGVKGGKAKSKGKRRAAPLTSEFWNKKVEAEGRKEVGETVLPGVISRYSVKQGYGFIRPDSPQGLPKAVKKKMNEAEAAAEAEGKEVKEKGLLYFRKPDVNHQEGGHWVWVDEAPKVYKTKGKGKGKGVKGGKAKGKGKRRAAPLKSEFWNKKVEAEGRKEIGDTVLPGVISRYSVKQGYGFIKADNPQGLPIPVQKKMNEAEAAAEAEGKEVKEKGLLYFRKPDVNHEEGFKLTEGTMVTFRLYVDNLGAGALDVTMA